MKTKRKRTKAHNKRIAVALTGKKLSRSHRGAISNGMRHSRRIGKYPWAKWLAIRGAWFRIHYGIGRDFDCSFRSMAQYLRNKASENDLSAQLVFGASYIEVLFEEQ